MDNGEAMSKKSNTPTGARHHSARQHLDSPSTREVQAQPGNLICKQCRASYHDKHWYSEDQSLKRGFAQDTTETLCPGCDRVEKQICNGTVIIEGPELEKIREELLRVVDRVAHECWLDNPTSRMFDLTENDGKIEFKTTTEWLATRIGKSLKKTYNGVLEIKRSPEKDLVRIHWFACH